MGADENNNSPAYPMNNNSHSSHIGIIIGIMTSIIVVLVGAIVAMSIRNCKQSGTLSILPASFKVIIII